MSYRSIKKENQGMLLSYQSVVDSKLYATLAYNLSFLGSLIPLYLAFDSW